MVPVVRWQYRVDSVHCRTCRTSCGNGAGATSLIRWKQRVGKTDRGRIHRTVPVSHDCLGREKKKQRCDASCAQVGLPGAKPAKIERESSAKRAWTIVPSSLATGRSALHARPMSGLGMHIAQHTWLSLARVSLQPAESRPGSCAHGAALTQTRCRSHKRAVGTRWWEKRHRDRVVCGNSIFRRPYPSSGRLGDLTVKHAAGFCAHAA